MFSSKAKANKIDHQIQKEEKSLGPSPGIEREKAQFY